MKKAILLLCVVMAVFHSYAQSGAKFLQGEDMTNVNRVSPNGKYAVGTSLESQSWGSDMTYGFKSFLWKLEPETFEWVTELTGEDYSKSGYFSDVNDNNVICGWFKDPNYKITKIEMGTEYTLPLNVAAIWNEGTLTSLGLGDFDISEFNYFNDGSFATSISNDSKTVVGYISTGNMANTYPCAWVKDDATGNYKYVKYNIPDNAINGIITDVSGDGSIAVGHVKCGRYTIACYWTSPDNCVLLQDPEIKNENGTCYAVSNNGKFIAFTYDEFEPCVYVVEEEKIIKCGRYQEVSNLEIGAVTDNGDVFGVYKYGSAMVGGMFNRPFWYSYANQTSTGFDYFVKTWASDVDMPYEFSYESKESIGITSASIAGNIILGNGSNKAFAIKTNATAIKFPPTVKNLRAKVTALGEIDITADIPNNTSDFSAKQLVIYRNGDVIASIPINGETTIKHTDTNVQEGKHEYTASIIYKDNKNSTDIESPRSGIVAVQMESSFALPLYDNFDTGSLSANSWTVVKEYGETDYQVIACQPFTGIKSSSTMHTLVDQYLPYSFYVVSKHLDATEKETVYASFARSWEYVNSTNWPLDQDTISFEISTDGENWIVAKDMPLCNTTRRWTFEYVDLTPWASGKIFQVRFRLHGQAMAQYIFDVDEFKIAEKPEREGMTDVLGELDTNGNFRLSWKNSLNAYPLTYLTSPYTSCKGLAIGDEGRTFIAVNSFDKEDLSMFKGKYLTSISTMINHDTSLEGTKDTHVSVVVFEDGKLIREQEFTPKYNSDQNIKLDEPLLIDGTKELKIGLKLFDYDARQLPLPYFNSYSYVPGKSDLYSEDGGNTWKKLSDLWAGQENEEDGYASWQITGNVTDESNPDVPSALDLDRFAAEVYKNGEKLSERFIYLLEPGYTDEETCEGDTYQVRIFYTDGTCTELSNIVKNNGATSIKDIEDGNNYDNTISIEGNELINNGNSEIEIYNSNGVLLYKGHSEKININSFTKGVFVIKVYKNDGSVAIHKFML